MRNLQGLVSFVETAETGSFTAASVKLDITPAAVGKNVLRLEQELGVRLFNRSTRRLRLTAEGEAFLGEASAALRSLDVAVSNVSRSATEPVGRVRITSGIAFGQHFVLPLLPKLAQCYPKLDVELSLENRTVDLVAEGYDIAVRGGLISDSRLVMRRIGPLSSVLVASPSYLRRYDVPTSPDDLLRDHCLLGLRFASGNIAPWRFQSADGSGTVEWEPPARIWASDPEAFLELAAAGEGICQTGLLYAAPLLRSGRLKLVLHDLYDHGERQIALCYSSRRQLSKRVRVVLDALLAGLAEQPDLQIDVTSVPAAWRA
ncbi:LysR family transcriptional regulator [Chitinivorax sp. B]|uniref:LysR family transcriptional regulator n=1 Tax=Chitinivorax sp. B TaxID=2502235 RepID=UPI0010F66EAA|nr:LysR family transcriptional regulator [Chitinivorax sp. B]